MDGFFCFPRQAGFALYQSSLLLVIDILQFCLSFLGISLFHVLR